MRKMFVRVKGERKLFWDERVVSARAGIFAEIGSKEAASIHRFSELVGR